MGTGKGILIRTNEAGKEESISFYFDNLGVFPFCILLLHFLNVEVSFYETDDTRFINADSTLFADIEFSVRNAVDKWTEVYGLGD